MAKTVRGAKATVTGLAKAGVRRARAVVSVAFSRADFERLDHHVETQGVTLSEFIRESAMARVDAESAAIIGSVTAGGAAATAYLAEIPASTTAPGWRKVDAA